MKPGETFAKGKYTLLRKLRSSGMAEVWLARQHGTEGFAKDVVLKRILPHLAEDEKLVTMFLDEARIAANLSHANVVQIFDLGNDGGDYFIAMEYIKGHDIEQIQEQLRIRRTPFPIEFAVRMIADTCLGLSYAHDFVNNDGTAMNVVHRDVSPQNILVSETGVVKLIDFGIAKARTSSSRTQVGHTKGKICYMSPEQMMARDLDRRSDLFSAGVVLYEMLCGEKPFDGDNLLACFHKLMKEGITHPKTLRPDLPDRLANIMMRALERDREERFPTATAFRKELNEFLREEGIAVGPEHIADFLKWLFVAPEATQVVLDMPRVKPLKPKKDRKLTPSRPPALDPMPSASDRRRNFGSGADGSTRRTNQPPVFGGLHESTTIEDPTTMEERTVMDGLSGSAPSLGGAFSSPGMMGGGFHGTGPSLGSVNLDFGEDEDPYRSQRRRRQGGGAGPIVVMVLFLLLVGGAVAAHVLGLLPGAGNSNGTNVTPPKPSVLRSLREEPSKKADAGVLVRTVPDRRPAARRRTKPRKVVKRSVRPQKRILKRRPPPRRRRRYGYLTIDITPPNRSARVSIDGSINYIRLPMLRRKRLRAGMHYLRFLWSPNNMKRVRVYIRAGRTKNYLMKLK